MLWTGKTKKAIKRPSPESKELVVSRASMPREQERGEHGGQVREVGPVLQALQGDGQRDEGQEVGGLRGLGGEEVGLAQSIGGEDADRSPQSSGGQASRGKPKKGSRGKEGLSLRSHHATLNAESYVPPPPKEFEAKYTGKKRKEPKGRKLTDEQVIALRSRDPASKTYAELAKEYGVSSMAIVNAKKGITFRHLNFQYPPLM
jgi:hypothetical protein